jgi:hypothetical protein
VTRKTTNPDEINPWADAVEAIPAEALQAPVAEALAPATKQPRYAYDLEGLMTDFPTAKELERFVYDETGYVLNLKGRANRLKYQVAMDTLNGSAPDPEFIGHDNPYMDRAEMIPVEDLRPIPDRDPTLPPATDLQNAFVSRFIPHPDPEYRARNRKVDCLFRKYKNGMISYEILGPLEQRPEGEKQDKFGRLRPEIIRWVDPRTGEQVIVRRDGTLTPLGRNLRAIMQKMQVNNSNQWQVWIDREFVALESGQLRNPWDLEGES